MEKKNEILSKLDFQAFYEREVDNFSVSKRNGQGKAICPFHEDTDPSLSLNLTNGLFNCFGCDAGGSVFDFYMKKYSVDFKTSISRLSEVAGIETKKRTNLKKKKLGKLVAVYDYQDANGNLLFQVCRFNPKNFRQRRPNPKKKGTWIWNMKGVTLVPYRLPELKRAKTVYLVEGEKDADLLVDLGLVASCNPMGAGKWRDEFKRYFKDKKVIILPDNDDQGRKHSEEVANSVHETASVVRVVELTGLSEKGDVADWINNGHKKNDLLSLVENAKKWEPTVESINFFKNKSFVPASVVDYIIKKYDIFHDGSSFYFYNEDIGVWVGKHDNVVGKIIKDALKEKSRRNHIVDVMKQLEYERFKSPDELIQNYKLINLLNGMLDIQTRKLLPHKKEYYSKVQVPIEFNPNAKCPRFLQFLKEIFKDDLNKINALQEFSGYCLYPEIFIDACLFLIGGGANGKSVYINILTKVVGKENVSALDPHQFSNKFLLGTLKDKLLNVSSEIQTKSHMESNFLKQVISGDLVQADIKYKQPFTFRPFAKHIFSMNEIPLITDRTYAMKRRLIILKFNQTFLGAKDDKRLEKKLTEELPGILNWALVGLSRVLKNETIMESEQMEKDRKEFMRSINPLLIFVEEYCVLDENALVGKDDLFKAYKIYCYESGLRHLSKIKFYHQLLHDFPEISECRPDGGNRHFKGIKILI